MFIINPPTCQVRHCVQQAQFEIKIICWLSDKQKRTHQTTERNHLVLNIMQTVQYNTDDLESLAGKYGYKTTSFNRKSKVISFGKDHFNIKRINVYFTTGTVATCLKYHPKCQKQLFRRGLCLLQEIEEIFKNPRRHSTNASQGGYYTRTDRSQRLRKESSLHLRALTPEEKEVVLWGTNSNNLTDDSVWDSNLMFDKGNKSICKSLQSHGAVQCVAFDSSCLVIIYKNGNFWKFGDISQNLWRILYHNKIINPVVFLSFGSNGEYFVRFADRSCHLFYNENQEAPAFLETYHHNKKIHNIDKVFFGPQGERVITFYNDNSTKHFNICNNRLRNILNVNKRRIENLSFGSYSQYFLSFYGVSWPEKHLIGQAHSAFEYYKRQNYIVKHMFLACENESFEDDWDGAGFVIKCEPK
jgi:hypothetical protein